jgi:hypothetical protein
LDREAFMTSFTAADRIEVHVLVDNVTDRLSTVPSYVENEWSYLWRNGVKRLGSGYHPDALRLKFNRY